MPVHVHFQSAETITQWTKKVIIERQSAHFDPDAPITAPVIRIEKQSSSTNINKSGSPCSVRATRLSRICGPEYPR